MRFGGVVVAGEAIRRARHMAAMVWRLGCDRGGQSHLLGFKTVHFVMRQMIFALIIIAVLAAIGVLTLARRVVHQRPCSPTRDRSAFQTAAAWVMRQLAAQVQAVFGAVETARVLHGIDHLLQILKTIAAIAHVAIATASSTVVMPLATIMASWLLIAEWAGQSTFGRG